MKRPTCEEWVQFESASSLLYSLGGVALFLQPQLEGHSHQSKVIQEEEELLKEVLYILFFFLAMSFALPIL